MNPTYSTDQPPSAELVPVPRRSLAWLLPVLSLALTVFLFWQAWSTDGLLVQVRFEDGHGVTTGDAVRFRGIEVGRVEQVRLGADLSAVQVSVRLDPGAEDLARKGTRFWVVRPELSLDSVQGLETVVGARYLAVSPGPVAGRRQLEFEGLEEAPVREALEPGGVELVLEAGRRGGLAPGAPLTYRGIQVGSVLSVGLASDATRVEVRAWVRPAYAQLVRERTRFWETGGVELGLSLGGGFRFAIDSLRSVLVGGVALATPPDGGAAVPTGARFLLHEDPEDAWLAWSPALPVGSALLPPGSVLPRPLRASKSWTRKGLLSREGSLEGWVVPVRGGIVAPADLFEPEPDARDGRTLLELSGEVRVLEPLEAGGAARFLPLELSEGNPLPEDRVRRLSEAEDCLVVADPARAPRALSAVRLRFEAGGGEVDGALGFDEEWHGAAVVARRDGAWVGILLVEPDGTRLVPPPDALLVR